MKNWGVLLLATTALCASHSAVSAEKQNYKCAVSTGLGDQLVFYRWHQAQSSAKQAKLVGSQVALSEHLKKRKTYKIKQNKVYVERVYECTLVNQDFKSAKAKSLDEQTPR
ncbi:TapY2 family type IVa secretion system protein [Paraferrimonas haliotis]|uniref:Uncharacterized protein n=1 Tax=Paraferrimonas haliotis TaxID=2013866 RepID=A0AA37WVG4_9GAMM|nr:TapY2 family type IVa secretion system protein [Paraferrimonas haliotis]GLS82563.1 hypothetical protein GCM10007894_05400 [Paraferrimonas haliotis]